MANQVNLKRRVYHLAWSSFARGRRWDLHCKNLTFLISLYATWSSDETPAASCMVQRDHRVVKDANGYGLRKKVRKTLLDSGADVNARNAGSVMPLMYVAEWAPPEIVRRFLDKGTDPNLKSEDGQTALMKAASRGAAANVQLLIDRGADMGARDNSGRNALGYAILYDHENVEWILDRSAGTE
jgi:ankyrin repeat protein